MILTLPIQIATPHQRMTIVLDGVRFRFLLDWNGRIGRWIVGMEHADSGRPLFSGSVLATRSNLLSLYRYSPDCPKGAITAIDVQGLDREAGFATLGADDGIALVYITAS